MTTHGDSAALRAVEAFVSMFNAQDHEGLARTLNYPHVRLARGRFATIETAEQFARRSEHNHPNLIAEGWHHTVLKSVEVVHSGEAKVHFALVFDRCHDGGEVYNQFQTLWIATCVDGHWGIQFRSSYL